MNCWLLNIKKESLYELWKESSNHNKLYLKEATNGHVWGFNLYNHKSCMLQKIFANFTSRISQGLTLAQKQSKNSMQSPPSDGAN